MGRSVIGVLGLGGGREGAQAGVGVVVQAGVGGRGGQW